MGRLTDAVLRHRRTVLAGWVVLCLLGAVLAAGLPARIVPGGEAPSSSQSEQVARALADSGLPSLFLTVEVDQEASPGALRRATTKAGLAVATVPGVTRVTPLPDPPGEPARTARIAVLSLSTTGGTDGAIEVARRLDERRDALTPDGATVFVGGFGAYRAQLTELSRSDLKRAERAGLPIVFIVLLLTFGSMWAAALPLAIAFSSLLLGLGAVGAFSHVLPMSDFVTNAASMIGIALGVDYAMFLLRRVRELMLDGTGTDDAIRTAMKTTGTAVLWSGVTVLAAEATLLLVDSRSIRSAAFGMVLVTLFAVLTALVVAPVLISVLGPRVTRTRRRSEAAGGSLWWERWARRVTRRAPLWLAGSALVMIALAIPALDLQESVNVSGASTLPADSSVAQAYSVAPNVTARRRSAR